MQTNGSDNDQTRSFTDLTAGVVISHYKIISKIGAGGMGEVWLAEDTELKRKVALKFLPPYLCQVEVCRARFKREAQATAALKHPNIVTIYEVSEFKGRPFFAMEHLEGRSLDEVIKSKELSPDQVVNLAVQLCEGLHEAHQAGVIHRDIKPSNIILDKNNRPKLLDFGLATIKGAQKLTETGSTLGTIGYMSPEQVEGKKTDQRSDLFSLGVLLYELVTGTAPFKGEYQAATFYAIVHEAAEPMARYKSGVSDALQRVVSKLLEKDPALRYQSAEGVLPDLKQLVASGSQDRITVTSRPKTKLRRILTPSIVVALIVMIVLILKPWRFEISSDNPALAAPRRLAVLYLKNRGVADDEYLSYGITEDLIVDLTRVGTMGVAPMPSILKYKDSDEELDKIAQHLQVNLLLNGSIHKSGDLIRVSAQLIDVESGLNLWAERWEETFENLPRIKEALAQGISQALAIDTSVMQAAQVGTPDAENPVAYDHYLRGKYTFENKSDESDVEVALGLYRKALELEPSLLAARRGVAAVLALRGQYDEANEELNTALEEARQRDLRSDEVEALLPLAGTHHEQSLYDEAQECAEQALEISKELNDLAGEVKALTTIIAIYQSRGMYNEAVGLFERVLEINGQLNDQNAIAKSLNNIGNIYLSQGDYAKALQNFEHTLEIATRLGDQRMIGMITGTVGGMYSDQGDYAKALQHYEQALEIATRLGDQSTMGIITGNIGAIYAKQGDYAKALQNYEQALEIATRLGDQNTMGKITGNIGLIYANQGDYAKALQNYEQALEIATRIGDRQGMAAATGFLSSVYGEQGDYRKSLDYARKYEDAAMALGTAVDSAWASLIVASVIMCLGEYNEAISTLGQVVTDAAQLGNAELLSGAHQSLGMAYFYKGESERAKENYHAALKGYEDMGNRSSMDVTNMCLGELYYFLNAPDSSRKYFEQGLALAEEMGLKKIRVRASAHLAALTAKGGDFDGGVKQLRAILEEAKGHGNIENNVIVKRLLGQVLTEDGSGDTDREEGRAILQEALSLATEQGYAHEIRWLTEMLEK